MTAFVKESVQYFGGMDIEGYARSVAEDAAELAIPAVRRRRPDLSGSAKRPAVPAEEIFRDLLPVCARVASEVTVVPATALLATMQPLVPDSKLGSTDGLSTVHGAVIW